MPETVTSHLLFDTMYQSRELVGEVMAHQGDDLRASSAELGERAEL